MAAGAVTSEENYNCLGWAARDPSGVLSPLKFSRRAPGPHDVSYRITHCGVCYAEIIWTRNHFGHTKYPVVPGHEMAGIVTEVGSEVSRFKVDDRVGTGTIVNSCRSCEFCEERMENYCEKGAVLTYDGVDHDGSITRGGFSTHIVVDERYCVRIPETLRLEHAAPLLCAGITVYSPMMRHGMNKPGKSIGVLGLGGLGHMAVKFAKSFGAIVTVLSTSASKEDEALKVLGADKFLVTSNTAEMEQATRSLDFILDTASAYHPLDLYLPLLKTRGTFVVVGAPNEMKFNPVALFLGMKSIAGSAGGGTKEAQEMVDYCGEHGIAPMIELIPMQYINTALDRLSKNDVRYRFVVNIEESLHME
ncbi:hypothetical protein GOP47_0013521 [Adiantum capillus-veneris]|uniref:Enoyl reductase (ER) domain-containing protein n=1 Tax=Adiantum capillus-veneris TaxID=13818 RepID=A0A9D4UNX2_ADICA|nr:hypothetical protein GOP47_0013521 [Adiantum capillus-veneris]